LDDDDDGVTVSVVKEVVVTVGLGETVSVVKEVVVVEPGELDPVFDAVLDGFGVMVEMIVVSTTTGCGGGVSTVVTTLVELKSVAVISTVIKAGVVGDSIVVLMYVMTVGCSSASGC